jgi:hypothetical protein
LLNADWSLAKAKDDNLDHTTSFLPNTSYISRTSTASSSFLATTHRSKDPLARYFNSQINETNKESPLIAEWSAISDNTNFGVSTAIIADQNSTLDAENKRHTQQFSVRKPMFLEDNKATRGCIFKPITTDLSTDLSCS